MGDEDVQKYILEKLSCQLLRAWHPTYRCGDQFTYEIWKNIPSLFKHQIIDQLKSNALVLRSMVSFFKQRYYIHNIEHERLMKQILFNPSKALQSNPYCDLQKPLCQPGQELVHSVYKEPGWKRSFGWNCRKCPKNFFKSSI